MSFNNVQTEHEPTSTATAIAIATEKKVEEKENKVEAILELNTLMTKFKKINTNENTIKPGIHNSQNQNSQNQNSQMIQMSEDIAFIKKSVIELTEKINKLMNI